MRDGVRKSEWGLKKFLSSLERIARLCLMRQNYQSLCRKVTHTENINDERNTHILSSSHAENVYHI